MFRSANGTPQSADSQPTSQSTIKNVSVAALEQGGGTVVRFEQEKEIKGTENHDGVCAALNTSILKKLLSGNEKKVEDYVNPLSRKTHDDIIKESQNMIALIKDGENPNHAPFLPFYQGSEIVTKMLNIEDLAKELKRVQAATLTYKTKQGTYHQVAFYRYDSDRCYITDANRLITRKTDVDASIEVLRKIIERSNCSSVEITAVPIKLWDAPEASGNSKDNSGAGSKVLPKSIEHDDETVSVVNEEDLSAILKTTAAQSFLYSFISSLSDEFVKDYLSDHHPKHIHWVNQAIHSLLLLATGNSLTAAVARPAANHLLVEYLKMSETTAGSITAGIMLAATTATVINNPRELKKAALTMAVGMGASLFGSWAAAKSYELVKNGVSAVKSYVAEAELSQDDDTDYTQDENIENDGDAKESHKFKLLF